MQNFNTECGKLLELEFKTIISYPNPFADIDVDCTFTSPSKTEVTIPTFYDGDSTWRVRFTPKEVGEWKYRVYTNPEDSSLNQQGKFTVEESKDNKAFVRACPGKYWGFEYETGEPCFLLGDTVYNLFGAAHCGMEIYPFLKRRKKQGFNIIRARCQVSPFHPGRNVGWHVPKSIHHGHSDYLTCSTWPWGGSPQIPRFDRFNLDYFRTVDRVLRLVDELDIGLEMIMEAWGFEYPFNARNVFLPEWERMWMRYLVARYDAFRSVYIWDLANEYEYYPDGAWWHDPVANRWALHMARWVKSIASHNHPIGVHTGPIDPPFVERFKRDPQAIDVILFQAWGFEGVLDKDRAWLAAGIEEEIRKGLNGWPGSAIFAEHGYERNPNLPISFPPYRYTNNDYARRGCWRGAFSGLCVMNGFENTAWAYMILDEDQEGVNQLSLLKRFFIEIAPFQYLRPCYELITQREKYQPGHVPLCLSSDDRKYITVYLPAGGEVSVHVKSIGKYTARWFDPRTGELTCTKSKIIGGKPVFARKEQGDQGRPLDWILVLQT